MHLNPESFHPTAAEQSPEGPNSPRARPNYPLIFPFPGAEVATASISPNSCSPPLSASAPQFVASLPAFGGRKGKFGLHPPCSPPPTTSNGNALCVVPVWGRALPRCSPQDRKCVQFSTETRKAPHLRQICNPAWGKMGNKFSWVVGGFFLPLEKALFPGKEQS